MGSGEPYFGWPESPKRTGLRKTKQRSKQAGKAASQLGGASIRLGGASSLKAPSMPIGGASDLAEVNVGLLDKVLSTHSMEAPWTPVGGALDPRDHISRGYLKAPGTRNSTTTQAINSVVLPNNQ